MVNFPQMRMYALMPVMWEHKVLLRVWDTRHIFVRGGKKKRSVSVIRISRLAGGLWKFVIHG